VRIIGGGVHTQMSGSADPERRGPIERNFNRLQQVSPT
jgi:hypothetical protein